MNALDELKEIVNNQKTVRTSRLKSLVAEVDKQRIQQAKKINKQKKQLNSLQRRG